MERLAAFPVHADHYFFELGDTESEFYDLPSVDAPIPGVLGNIESGYATNGSSVIICTCGDLNWHWMEIYLAEVAPEFGAAERVTMVSMIVQSGEVSVSSVCGEYGSVSLAPGLYTVYILGFSLGHDDMSDIPNPDDWPKDRSDAELAALTDYEHYHVFFVPGDSTDGKIGVVHGGKTSQGA